MKASISNYLTHTQGQHFGGCVFLHPEIRQVVSERNRSNFLECVPSS